MSTELRQCGILVVEDEKSIRWILQRFLQEEGFDVWAAACGQEAVPLFREHAANICLVLLDVRLGNMNGIQTALELRAICPDLAICFMTGDPNSPTMAAANSLAPVSVLVKPFGMDEALQEVKRSLPSHCASKSGTSPPQKQPNY